MARRRAADDIRCMESCLALAVQGAGRVSPNPMVGAMLVGREGEILSTGYHRVYGGPHAEADCLRRFQGEPRGATLYVNLEPCAHHGKTPPCADLIIRSGIRRVVVAMLDPNPLVSGRGVARLRRSGVRVTVGVRADAARLLNRHFIRHIRSRRPYVHVKIAQTLDGRIAPSGGRRVWISSIASRRLVHQWRSTHDAVLVGAGTVLADDPHLNVRLIDGRDPDVVILDGALRVRSAAAVFRDTVTRRVFVCTGVPGSGRARRVIQELSLAGAVVLTFPARDGRISLRRVLSSLYRHHVGSLLVEGGGDVFNQFLTEGLADELSLFVAPRVLQEGVAGFPPSKGRGRSGKVGHLDVRQIGKDLLLTAMFRERAGRNSE